jgi:hypothetical protein
MFHTILHLSLQALHHLVISAFERFSSQFQVSIVLAIFACSAWLFKGAPVLPATRSYSAADSFNQIVRPLSTDISPLGTMGFRMRRVSPLFAA